MKEISLVVHAREHTRQYCPVRVVLEHPLPGKDTLVLKDTAGTVVPCQLMRAEKPSLCFILDELAKGESRTLTITAQEGTHDSGVEITDVPGERADVTIAGRLFTSYRYTANWARPFLMPIIGPYGDPITRMYPVEDVDGETTDHIHHKSCWVAWGDVNGSDNWSETEGHGRQTHQRLGIVESGPVFGRIAALNHWVTDAGAKVLEEEREMLFYNLPESGRIMDLNVRFTATEGPVRFGDTKEGGIASVRVATSMDGSGAGTIVNAYGGIGEKETWGKRAHWCDYYGPVKGKTVGIAIFDTPTNFRYPTYWHVRDYGLMTANPFGLSHFYGDEMRDGSHTIGEGESLCFAYRLFFHAGNTDGADVSGRFLDYVTPPVVEIE